MTPMSPGGATLLTLAVALTWTLGLIDSYLLYRSLMDSHHYRGGGPLYLILGWRLMAQSPKAYALTLKLLPFVLCGAVAMSILKILESRQMAAVGVARLGEFQGAWVSWASAYAFAFELPLLIALTWVLAHPRVRALFPKSVAAGPGWSLHLAPQAWRWPPVVAVLLAAALLGPHLVRNPFSIALHGVKTRLAELDRSGLEPTHVRTVGLRNWSHVSRWRAGSRELSARVDPKGRVTIEGP